MEPGLYQGQRNVEVNNCLVFTGPGIRSGCLFCKDSRHPDLVT